MLKFRKFAAQISTSQRHCPEETKKLKPSVPSSNEFGDCIFVDVEENKSDNPDPVPMFLEETENSRLSEADEMVLEEVEMEDIVEDPIFDIDGCDAKNPLAVVDYVEDLYAYYRKMESFGCVSPSYMAQQSDINEKMRAILIDWLIEIFVPSNSDEKEASVGWTSCYALSMQEKLMLNTLQFNMSFPTPYVFMRRFLKAAQSDKKLELLSFFLIELALVEYEMLKFQPSLLAAAAIYTAQSSLYGFKQWSKTCEWHSNYSEAELLECSRLMVGFHEKAATGKLTGVHRKYCTSKFGYTAKCEPAKFLLQTQA
ncbi:hypothetical protein COLO4_22539 [Corchorus olitorius]|uniref:Cyclin N-terminal domain-containing protein n=1 Tax=Corchorus olitorius TaxID=93759 RepID=A0A1R3ILF7_9ROSI|nr:hypothetical protein COLO4_22539 [Corchorus olitorius]